MAAVGQVEHMHHKPTHALGFTSAFLVIELGIGGEGDGVDVADALADPAARIASR